MMIVGIILVWQFWPEMPQNVAVIEPQLFRASLINSPGIAVTYPVGGEQLLIGSFQRIKWESLGVSKVKIYVCANLPGLVCILIPGFPQNGIDANLGTYQYKVPIIPEFVSIPKMRVKIFDANSNYRIYGESKDFYITTSGTNINTEDINTPNSSFAMPLGVNVSKLAIKSINTNFSKSGSVTTLPAKPIYSLSVSGNWSISKSDGYARIILTDNSNKQYLVYEAAGPFDSGNSSFTNICQETCALDGIIPSKITTEISGASIKIISISTAEDKTLLKPEALQMGPKAYQQQITQSQQQTKLTKVQEYITKNNLRWTAGATSVSKYSFEEKRKLFGITGAETLPNTQGFEYYEEGIFDFYELSPNNQYPESQLPQSFDWRNVHGENWLTPVKNQGQCGSCWAFSIAGTIEATTNLYFNQHLDANLSEQDILSCYHPFRLGCLGIDIFNLQEVWGNISAAGVTYESCFPYQSAHGACENKCNQWKENEITFGGNELLDLYLESPSDTERLKEALINNGPISVTLGSIGHDMILVGYYTDQDKWPVWVFKNSWGTNWGEKGYTKLKKIS